MELFKVKYNFEQDGKWSGREADLEGYLVKKSEDDDTVEGYATVLYPTFGIRTRYIKGLYKENGSLIFAQVCKDGSYAPICYYFPTGEEYGYWSAYNNNRGSFFPVFPGWPCSMGRATLQMQEVTDASEAERASKAIFDNTLRSSPNWETHCVMSEYRDLKDLMSEGMLFQMKLHCGKW